MSQDHEEGPAHDELRRRVRDLPREIEPERDLWEGIRMRIETGEAAARGGTQPRSPAEAPERLPERQAPGERRGSPRPGPRIHRRFAGGWSGRAGWGLGVAGTAMAAAVAALLLVPGSDPPAGGSGGSPAAGSPSAGLSVGAASVEAAYEPAIQELRLLAASEDLAPETRRELDASLAVIDEAIEEAREAVAADPAAPTAMAGLKRLYESKVQVLRMAATSY